MSLDDLRNRKTPLELSPDEFRAQGHRLVDRIADLKLRGTTTKALLKRAADGILPDEIIHRSKKGFAIPLSRYPGWLQEVVRFTPLYQGVEVERRLVLGALDPTMFVHVGYLVVMAVAGDAAVVARHTDRASAVRADPDDARARAEQRRLAAARAAARALN